MFQQQFAFGGRGLFRERGKDAIIIDDAIGVNFDERCTLMGVRPLQYARHMLLLGIHGPGHECGVGAQGKQTG